MLNLSTKFKIIIFFLEHFISIEPLVFGDLGGITQWVFNAIDFSRFNSDVNSSKPTIIIKDI